MEILNELSEHEVTILKILCTRYGGGKARDIAKILNRTRLYPHDYSCMHHLEELGFITITKNKPPLYVAKEEIVDFISGYPHDLYIRFKTSLDLDHAIRFIDGERVLTGLKLDYIEL